MTFEGDAFISYAHLDNVGLIEGHKGWVASLHRALQIRLAQLLGKDARIWWDPKLQGNDYFEVTLSDRLQRVAALIAVVSPRYIKSEWGRKEIEEFCKAADQQGGLRIQDKARIFKVLKTPVPLDEHPPELQSLLGYEFFTTDPETGRVRELDEVFGPEAQRDFWLKLDDLAHDLCCLLKVLEPEEIDPESSPDAGAVYLAFTTTDLKDEREVIRRDLEQHGITVLPDRALPLEAADVCGAVRDDLARCRMSIHLVGPTYSLVPEGSERSLTDIQNDLAIERAAAGGFSRLVWIEPGLHVRDERQRQLIERLRSQARSPAATDLIERPLEDLRTVIAAWLKKSDRPSPDAAAAPAQGPSPQLYLLYDQRDAEAIAPWADCLFKDFEIIHPMFAGDEAEIRGYHEENLRNCDGSLIFYGAGNECWLRRKMREVQKSAGYGRSKPAPLVGVCLIAPRTREKERFRTHDAIVVPQWDGLRPETLETFVTRLKGCARPAEDDALG